MHRGNVLVKMSHPKDSFGVTFLFEQNVHGGGLGDFAVDLRES
jgi:hypothetical protein